MAYGATIKTLITEPGRIARIKPVTVTPVSPLGHSAWLRRYVREGYCPCDGCADKFLPHQLFSNSGAFLCVDCYRGADHFYGDEPDSITFAEACYSDEALAAKLEAWEGA